MSYLVLVVFVVFSFIGVMEANNPNYLQVCLYVSLSLSVCDVIFLRKFSLFFMILSTFFCFQPFLNQGMTWHTSPTSREPLKSGSVEIPNGADGIEVPDDLVEGPRNVVTQEQSSDGFKEVF